MCQKFLNWTTKLFMVSFKFPKSNVRLDRPNNFAGHEVELPAVSAANFRLEGFLDWARMRRDAGSS